MNIQFWSISRLHKDRLMVELESPILASDIQASSEGPCVMTLGNVQFITEDQGLSNATWSIVLSLGAISSVEL